MQLKQRLFISLCLAFLLAVAFYQFRLYRIDALKEETRQGEISLQVEKEKSIRAIISASNVVRVPVAGMKTSEYESGCLSALTRAGTINAENRIKLIGTGIK